MQRISYDAACNFVLLLVRVCVHSTDLEMAIAYWNIVLKDRFKFLDIWCQFLQVYYLMSVRCCIYTCKGGRTIQSSKISQNRILRSFPQWIQGAEFKKPHQFKLYKICRFQLWNIRIIDDLLTLSYFLWCTCMYIHCVGILQEYRGYKHYTMTVW